MGGGSSCCSKDKTTESNRIIKINDATYNSQQNYADNYIKTSKYTILTFLPKNLFEQFQRLANAYFLFLLILQLIPWVTSLTSVTTAIPLIAVVSLTAIKDLIDDILIPEVSSLTPLATVIPLVAVLLVSISKDGADDLQRHYSDNQVNNRLSWVLRDGRLVEEKWKHVVVGDIIKMENDHFVAADLLLLSTSEPNGLCYIETAELDGETNLKVKQALPVTAAMGDHMSLMSRLNGQITCEPPNNNLNRFEGVLRLEHDDYSLNNEKILMRGCVLRNTQWCYGLVIFAGKDTKLMMNSGQAVFKRTNIDRLLNILIVGIFIFLLCSCLFCTMSSIVWESLIGYNFQVYLPWEWFVPQSPVLAGSTAIAFLGFLSYIIVFNTVVPISLYVSIEMIRFAHSWWINWDKEMYYERIDMPAKARTTTLNEELGQIEYIFSDKTGTLTQNVMTFKKCSINGRAYGEALDSDGNVLPAGSTSPRVDFSFNPLAETAFRWQDYRLLTQVDQSDEHVCLFFRVLALCHTVMVENKDGCFKYQAQSPDENALVSAARNFGFVFTARSPNSITIEVKGVVEEYELLNILDFNNVRKRMSVIVRRDDKIMLFCKGADSIIYERLSKDSLDMKEITASHLDDFSIAGLRTLVIAFREVDEDYYRAWQKRYHDASTSMVNREELMEAMYEEIEQDMTLLGATAIEDKLQSRVPETIASLSLAGIKIWVLTGDKQETAVNVGYSCKLLTDDLEDIYVVDGDTMETVEQQLLKARDDMIRRLGINVSPSDKSKPLGLSTQSRIEQLLKRAKNNKPTESKSSPTLERPSSSSGSPSDEMPSIRVTRPSHCRQPSVSSQHSVTADDMPDDFGGFAIIVNGNSLVHALTDKLELLLLEVGCMCKSVICCRVTPLQKALVVDLVKRNKKSITLAIGDGANDVSMIRTAHIGVGISGQEGMQAVLASDFAIAQFRFLQRLLLVHGRYSYLRICRFLRYFFYKNFAFTLCHFWFAFFCGFSAQTLLDPYFIMLYNLLFTSLPVMVLAIMDKSLFDEAYVSLYNVCYTSLPILVLGIFEKDVNEYYSLKYPKLYTPGHLDLFFNKLVFGESVCEGIFMSAIIFFITYGTYHSAATPTGLDQSDYHSFGFVVASILIVAVTLRCSLDIVYWTGFNHFVVWGSIVFYFVFTYVFYIDYFEYSYMGTASAVMGTAQFWLTLTLAVTATLLPVVVIRFWRIETRPTLSHRLRVKQQMLSKTKSGELILRKHSLRRSMQSFKRSGYAFSHMEGFGRLIMSGLNMTPEQRLSRFSGSHIERRSTASKDDGIVRPPSKQSTSSATDKLVQIHQVPSQTLVTERSPTPTPPLPSSATPNAGAKIISQTSSDSAKTRGVKSETLAMPKDRQFASAAGRYVESAGNIALEDLPTTSLLSPSLTVLPPSPVAEKELSNNGSKPVQSRPSILKARPSDVAARPSTTSAEVAKAMEVDSTIPTGKSKSAHFVSPGEVASTSATDTVAAPATVAKDKDVDGCAQLPSEC